MNAVNVTLTDRTRDATGAFVTTMHRVVVNDDGHPMLVAAQIVAATHPDHMVLSTDLVA